MLDGLPGECVSDSARKELLEVAEGMVLVGSRLLSFLKTPSSSLQSHPSSSSPHAPSLSPSPPRPSTKSPLPGRTPFSPVAPSARLKRKPQQLLPPSPEKKQKRQDSHGSY